MTDKWVVESPLDMHVHFRTGTMLNVVAPYTAKYFSGALIMPNLVPPVDNLDALKRYTEEVLNATEGYNFKPYMTLFFRDDYTEEFLKSAKEHILAIKMYPKGITTNSATGADLDSPEVERVLAIMQDLEIPLCVHGEDEKFVMEREHGFYQRHLPQWVRTFPNLKIILEHITDRRSLHFLNVFQNVYATITVHHLLLTLDDVVGGMMRPHLFCKPIAKTPLDRDRLRNVIFSKPLGMKHVHHKVMLGTDSAPHPVSKKECCGCAAGIFSAPVALQVLAEEFYQNSTRDKFQAFISGNALTIYGIDPPEKWVTLVRTDSVVPEAICLDRTEIPTKKYLHEEYFRKTISPFMAGETLKWSYVES